MILFQIDADAFWVTLGFRKIKFGDLGYCEIRHFSPFYR